MHLLMRALRAVSLDIAPDPELFSSGGTTIASVLLWAAVIAVVAIVCIVAVILIQHVRKSRNNHDDRR